MGAYTPCHRQLGRSVRFDRFGDRAGFAVWFARGEMGRGDWRVGEWVCDGMCAAVLGTGEVGRRGGGVHAGRRGKVKGPRAGGDFVQQLVL